MLHHIGEIYKASIDTRLLERAIEQLACRSHERVACKILGSAGLLAHEHQFRAGRSLADDGLRTDFVQPGLTSSLPAGPFDMFLHHRILTGRCVML